MKTMTFLLFLVMLVVMSQFYFHARDARKEGRRTKMMLMLIGVIASFGVGAWAFALCGTKIAIGLGFGESLALGALVEVVVALLYGATFKWVSPWLARQFPKMNPDIVSQLAILPIVLLLILILK